MLKLALCFLLTMGSAQSETKDFSPSEAKLMGTEALRLWQKRDDEISLQESLSKFEYALGNQESDLETLTYLTRGYFILGELHHTNEDLKKKAFERAREFGERGLLTNSDYKKWIEKDKEKAIDLLTDREASILFWKAASLGKWAKLNGIMSSLKYKSEILSSIKKVEKLRPDYYYGAVPRYWGGFYTVAPSIAGGDMKKGKENFLKAMSVAPEYLGTKTLYAELYLVKKDDKKEFKKQLQEVLEAPNTVPELIPENNLEKKKAQRLLDQMDDLF